MSITKTLGGDRINSGKKMKVELHGYERSTHNLSRVIRTTMSAGTVVPFMSTIGLPADTWDIELSCDIMTHPTIGPLFGSYKVDLHIFQAPIRLYNALLHNNMLGIGRDMSQVKLPVMEFTVLQMPSSLTNVDLDNCQINPSCVLKYLGLSGFGFITNGQGNQTRQFQMCSLLAYWETIKNYYSNKQEEIGAVIHTPQVAVVNTITALKLSGTVLPQAPSTGVINMYPGTTIIRVEFTGAQPIPNQVYITTVNYGNLSLQAIAPGLALVSAGVLEGLYVGNPTTAYSWNYTSANIQTATVPKISTFPLSNIDDMRNAILSSPSKTTPFKINTPALEPYKFLYEQPNGIPNTLSSQEGLAIKTYNSDLFNNWLNTANIDAITNASAIDTSGGFFTIDQLLVGKQLYNLLNRINVSGGTYDDWLEVVYDHEAIQRAESPIYHGGLIKELVFQEIISNSQTSSQPLGTLAGKGMLTNKHKGGNITIKVDEPTIILGLISLTPRIDYSQGNEWHMTLKTLNDIHIPQFDQIGFQDLMTPQMAWWDSIWNPTPGEWTEFSAGKQPAWINYMTDVNKNYGNFAITNNEMFMVLNRRYEYQTNPSGSAIKDLTTYIDPSKFNFIFAQTSLDAQNFWTQIGIKATVRRKMSAKIMPTI